MSDSADFSQHWKTYPRRKAPANSGAPKWTIGGAHGLVVSRTIRDTRKFRRLWSRFAAIPLIIAFWLLIVVATFMEPPPVGTRSDHPVPVGAPVALSGDFDDEARAWRSP